MAKKKGMTLEEFLENYDGAPFDTDEAANLASYISDSPELSKAAKVYLKARRELDYRLEEVGFEFG
ncbi:MAG: hypothetical protein WC375_09155 [Methanomassiliicoccales archaeon]|jgi:hypothetical protein